MLTQITLVGPSWLGTLSKIFWLGLGKRSLAEIGSLVV